MAATTHSNILHCSMHCRQTVFCQAFCLSLHATAVHDTNDNNVAQRCMERMYKSLQKTKPVQNKTWIRICCCVITFP